MVEKTLDDPKQQRGGDRERLARPRTRRRPEKEDGFSDYWAHCLESWQQDLLCYNDHDLHCFQASCRLYIVHCM